MPKKKDDDKIVYHDNDKAAYKSYLTQKLYGLQSAVSSTTAAFKNVYTQAFKAQASHTLVVPSSDDYDPELLAVQLEVALVSVRHKMKQYLEDHDSVAVPGTERFRIHVTLENKSFAHPAPELISMEKFKQNIESLPPNQDSIILAVPVDTEVSPNAAPTLSIESPAYPEYMQKLYEQFPPSKMPWPVPPTASTYKKPPKYTYKKPSKDDDFDL